MKQVEIFVIGRYDYRSHVGTWIYYLNYKKAVIKRCGQIPDAKSAARVTLYALYEALGCITEPCEIIVHSKSPLGFKRPQSSNNKDVIMKIMSTVNRAGHLIHFDTKDDFGRVDIWEQIYGTPVGYDSQNKYENKHNVKTAKPSIDNANTINDVFDTHKQSSSSEDEIIKEQAMQSSDWREMYSDLMGPSGGTWVPGSGGY